MILRIGIIISSCVLTACQQDEVMVSLPVIPVKVAQVEQNTTHQSVTLNAIARPAQQALLAFELNGTLEPYTLSVGEQVVTGQTLVHLDNPELKPALKAAHAKQAALQQQYRQTERDLRRYQRVIASGAVSQQDVEHLQTELQVLAANMDKVQAEIAQAKAKLQRSFLRSPMDGSITQIFRESGEHVVAGQQVLQVAGDSIEVEFAVPETVLPVLAMGQTVTLQLPLFNGQEIQGKITELSNKRSEAGQLFPVIISLAGNPPEIRAGVTLSWTIHLTGANALMVPLQAIVSPLGIKPRVYQVVNQQAQIVNVIPGEIIDDMVVIEAPLHVGDNVIIAGHNNLSGGFPVKVLP